MEISSIRFINLDKNWLKKTSIKLLLWPMPYKVIRCPGVIYNNKDRSYDKYLVKGIAADLGEERTKGVVGCWIAHSNALEKVTEQSGITVIIEDDFICQSDFFEFALKMVNSFNKDFDIIIFDTWGKGPLEIHRIDENIYQTNCYTYPFYGGTHCLFVNNSKIPKILDTKLNSPIKDYDGFLMANNKIITYIFYTGKSAQRNFGSDINPYFKAKYNIFNLLLSIGSNLLIGKTKIFNKFFHKPKPKKIVHIPKEKIKLLEGYYKLNKHLSIQFSLKNGQLTLIQLWDSTEIKFLPISDLEFICKELPIYLRFVKNIEGEITEVINSEVITYKRDNNFNFINRKTIKIDAMKLKSYEGKYQAQQNKDFTINIIALEDHLLFKQLWDGKELLFVPGSESEFFVEKYPSLSIRFVKNIDETITRIIIFDDEALDRILD